MELYIFYIFRWIEDFFGAWLSDEGGNGVFDPDKNWDVLFDVP